MLREAIRVKMIHCLPLTIFIMVALTGLLQHIKHPKTRLSRLLLSARVHFILATPVHRISDSCEVLEVA